MKIGSLEITNILSVKQARIEFSDTGLVLIEGFNYDDDTANGAGKTAIMNALSFGLYGKFPRKVTVSSILRYGTKKGHVIVDDIITNDGTWKVERHRPTLVKFYKNGLEQNITQAEFESKLQLTYSQFLISMYSAQTQGEKFIDMNDTSKKDFLLRLMNLDEFAIAKKIADTESKNLQQEIQNLKINEATLSSRVAVYNESVIDGSILEDQLLEISKNIKSSQDRIDELSKIQRPDVSQYDDIAQKIALKRVEIASSQSRRNEQMRLFQSLAQQYKNHKESSEAPGVPVNCPECNEEIRLVDGKLIGSNAVEELNEANRASMAALKQQCQEVKEIIDEQDVIIAKKPQIDQLEANIRSEKQKKYSEYDEAQRSIMEHKSYIAQQNMRISSINNQLSEQKERIQELERTKLVLKTARDTILSKGSELELLQTVSHIYSPTGAPAYIMDSVVGTFNDAIANYVSMIWPNASYSIQAFKENKNGDIKAKFSDKLILNGKQVSVGSLSGGQHRCLSLAIDFAMIEILANRFSIEINPVIFDEPLEGLDAANKERILEVFEKIAQNRNIIVIEHSSEFKSAFTTTMRVELRDGVSTVST